MRRVIINADDFGMNERNSGAIAEAFRKGQITDTTMMANGRYFDEALSLAREQGFDRCIGIHLNLTEGAPLTEAIKTQPRFVNDGLFYKGYGGAAPLTDAEQDAVYRELCAQVKKLQQAGICISHADSHHHIHTVPFVAPIVQRVLKEHGVDKVRLHRNLSTLSLSEQNSRERFNEQLRANGFKTTAYFAYVMDIEGGDIPDNTEILVHPDYDADGVLIDRRGMRDGCPVGNPLIDLSGDARIVLRGFGAL